VTLVDMSPVLASPPDVLVLRDLFQTFSSPCEGQHSWPRCTHYFCLALRDKLRQQGYSIALAIKKMSLANDENMVSAKKQTKTPAHTLIRVRNNQRRHRERQRQYIASLERKVQETEGLLAQARADITALEAELERWKRRSNATEGHSDGLTASRFETGQQKSPREDDLLQTSPLAPYSGSASETALVTNAAPADVSTRIPTSIHFIPVVPSPKPSCNSATVNPGGLLGEASSDFLPRCCAVADKPSEAALAGTAVYSSSAPNYQDLAFLPSTCGTYLSPDVESTTLCSQAYILIEQQNFRGLSAYSIKSWLYQGFRRAKEEHEGCRVENKLLFGLLDFISGA
jgi:hypothetical protein